MTVIVQPAAVPTAPQRIAAGTTAVLGVTFLDESGAPHDPTTVTVICGQDGTAGVALAEGSDTGLQRTAIGVYEASFDTSSSTGGLARWVWQWVGTGSDGASCAGTFLVAAPPFPIGSNPTPNEPVIDGGGAFTTVFTDTIDGGGAGTGA